MPIALDKNTDLVVGYALLALPKPDIGVDHLEAQGFDDLHGGVRRLIGYRSGVAKGQKAHPGPLGPTPDGKEDRADTGFASAGRDVDNQIIGIGLPIGHPFGCLLKLIAQVLYVPVVLKWVVADDRPKLPEEAMEAPVAQLAQEFCFGWRGGEWKLIGLELVAFNIALSTRDKPEKY